MAYYLDLYSPDTYETFTASDRSITGFHLRQLHAAEKVHPGDKLICYMMKLSRWVGILEVLSGLLAKFLTQVFAYFLYTEHYSESKDLAREPLKYSFRKYGGHGTKKSASTG